MDDYEGEESEPGLNEKMKPIVEVGGKILSQIITVVKKIGVWKIVAALAVIAGVYYYLNLPQPGVLTVNVLALDSGTPVNNAIVSLTSNGVSVGTPASETTSGGIATFTGVPSGQNIQVSVDGTPAYGVLTDFVTVQSGQSLTVTENLPLNYQLFFNPSSESLTATPTCVMNKNLTVTNNQSSSVTITLIGSGGLSSLVSSQQTIIPPGQSVLIPYTIDFSKGSFSSGSSVSGVVRPEGFNQGDSLTINFINSYQFQVSPSQLSCSQGQTCTGYITIQNTGSNVITGLKQPSKTLIPSTSGGLTPVLTITPTSGNSILPGGSASYYYSLQVPQGAVAGGYIDFNGDCFHAQVLIQTQ